MRVIVTHNNADLDALACLVAASRLYEGAVAVGGTSLAPAVQRYLALHKDHYPIVAPDKVDPDEVEEVVVVDVRDRRRLNEVGAIVDAAKRMTPSEYAGTMKRVPLIEDPKEDEVAENEKRKKFRKALETVNIRQKRLSYKERLRSSLSGDPARAGVTWWQ